MTVSDFVRYRAGRSARVAKGLRWKRWALTPGVRATRGQAAPNPFTWHRSAKPRVHQALGMSDVDPRRPTECRWDDRWS